MGKLPMCFFCSGTGIKLSNLHLVKLEQGRPGSCHPRGFWHRPVLRLAERPCRHHRGSRWGGGRVQGNEESFYLQFGFNFQIQIQDQRDMAHGGEGAGQEVAEGGGGQAGQVGQQTGWAGQCCQHDCHEGWLDPAMKVDLILSQQKVAFNSKSN